MSQEEQFDLHEHENHLDEYQEPVKYVPRDIITPRHNPITTYFEVKAYTELFAFILGGIIRNNT